VSETRQVSIDPITRLEGHGRIELFLDEAGNLADAFFQIPELRGFERFCRGRQGEDMPQITERICGVCPEAHHFASTKTLDACYAAAPPPRARRLREVLYNAYIFSDHLLHFYYLGGPDFLVGPYAPPEERNILGVVGKVGLEMGREVIKHRGCGQRIIEIVGGRPIHPVTGIPGGQAKGITAEERDEIRAMSSSMVEFAKTTLEVFHTALLKDETYARFVADEAQQMATYYMGLVDETGAVDFYDGEVRIVGPDGAQYAQVSASEISSLIEERTEPWTYVKIPYLKDVGWKGFVAGPDSGVYRVGPLARLNVCTHVGTPLAQAEYERFSEYFGGGPVHATFAYHWARLIEMLSAAERVAGVIDDPELMEGPLRTLLGEPGRGVGVIEAARGTLIHDYALDERGLIESVNLIVATTHNVAAISLSIKEMAKAVVKEGNVEEGILNLVEMSFRNYDPCLACATHALPGQMPLVIDVRGPDGTVRRRIERW
jgi:F420-non-reducing hydrogenase large subunit